MIVRVIDYVGKYHFVPGPPDLARYGEGDSIAITGDISDQDRSSWAIAIGLFVMRGGEA